MPEIEIRPALSADIADLVQIDHSVQTDYVWQMTRHMNEGEVVIQFREVRLPRSVRLEPVLPSHTLLDHWKERPGLLVARLNGDPVGYIGVTDQKATETAWVTDLAVAKNVRRQGIGTALVLAVQNWAASRRLKNVVLEVLSKNYPMIRLANKLGFEFCGYNDHYYRSQDIALFFTRSLK